MKRAIESGPDGTPRGRSRAAGRWGTLGLALLLVLGTILAYQPAWRAGFIWDDDLYVTNNPLLTDADGLQRIWFSLASPSQYFPLTYTVFRVERALWGLNPAGYHWVNLLLHTLNALLVWRLLHRLAVPGAWLAAAVFALHPVQVESVAWITELKNVLSLGFSLLALLAWAGFVTAKTRPRWGLYALALISYTLALCSKTTACTLPAALFLVLWLQKIPINRARWAQLVPFVILGMGMGLLAMWWERHHQGTGGDPFAIGPIERLLIASRAVWFHAGKLVWPVDLTFSYPRWTINPADPLAYGWLLVGAGPVVAIIFARRIAGRGPEVAAIFYVATLSPLLGFIMLYTFRYTFVADHYQYVACIGPMALGAALVARARLGTRRRAILSAMTVVVLPVLALLTWRQAQIYRDPETLWRATLANNPGSWLACDNLGNCLAAKGRIDEALFCYRESIRLNPDNASARYNLGQVLTAQKRFDEAIQHYTEAARLDSNSTTECALGVALASSGRRPEAIDHFRRATRLNPAFALGWYNLGLALCQTGQVRDGADCVRRALELDSSFAEAVRGTANALAAARRFEEAVSWYAALLGARPGDTTARVNLGNALAMTGRIDDAIAQYEKALEQNPGDFNARNNLGNLLLHESRWDEAIAQYAAAGRLDPANPETQFNWGRALARKGQYTAAADRFAEALRLKPDFTRAREELEAIDKASIRPWNPDAHLPTGR